jgi:hypothetical protein
MERIRALWNRGLFGKVALIGGGTLGLLVLCCVALLIVVPSSPRTGQNATAAPGAPNPAAAAPTEAPVVTAGPTDTPAPTETPAPTDTPAPTNTPEPTATPAPTDTPEPTATPIPPVVITGNGQTVTDKITLPYEISTVSFTHQGQRNFAVQLYTAESDQPELLVNTIGNYAGTRLLQGSSPIFFEITADGAWELTITRLTEDAAAANAQGSGDWVTGVFIPAESGPVPYRFTHTGSRNFAVYLHCDGELPDLAQNEIGAVDNEAVIRFGDGPCLWEVQADGDWTIAPK